MVRPGTNGGLLPAPAPRRGPLGGAARSAAGDDGQSSASAPVPLGRLHPHRGLDTIADKQYAGPTLKRRLAGGGSIERESVQQQSASCRAEILESLQNSSIPRVARYGAHRPHVNKPHLPRMTPPLSARVDAAAAMAARLASERLDAERKTSQSSSERIARHPALTT